MKRLTTRKPTLSSTLSAALILIVALASCRPQSAVPTIEVRRRDFVNRITAQGVLEAVESTMVTAPSRLSEVVSIAWLEVEGKLVEEGDVIASFDPTDLEIRLEDTISELDSQSYRLEKTESEGSSRITTTLKDRKVADLELRHAQNYEKINEDVFSRLEIAESRIDAELAGERWDQATRMEGVNTSLSRAEVGLVEVDRRKAEIRERRAQDVLDSLIVRAPRAGLLTWVRDSRGDPPRIGDEVWRGQELGEIPDLSTMQARVFVLEADAAGLAEGRPAELKVEAHPELILSGSISSVDWASKPRFRGSPVKYFGVTVRLDSPGHVSMSPGQRVQATLFLDRRPGVLVIPRQALFLKQGEPHVRVATASGLEARRIRVGAQSLGLSVVDEGLREGERVALEPPSAAPEVAQEARSGLVKLLGGSG